MSFQGSLQHWDMFWDLISNLIISGCDSTLTVLGMSAVISSMAHYLGLGILAFIGAPGSPGHGSTCAGGGNAHA